MQKKAFAAAGALAMLAAAACENEVSLTGPSTGRDSTAAVSLALTSDRHLVNEGPLCTGARTPGFFCQNQDGKNPNLTAEEFDQLEAEATARLDTALGGLTVGDAVCIKGNRAPADQLVRHLAALALNLAANLVDEATPLTGSSFASVGEAFAQGALVAASSEDKDERNAIKDVLDDINNNVDVELGDECFDEGEEDDLNR